MEVDGKALQSCGSLESDPGWPPEGLAQSPLPSRTGVGRMPLMTVSMSQQPYKASPPHFPERKPRPREVESHR